MKKKILWLAPFVVAGAGLAFLGTKNPGNSAQTQEDHADSRLRTRHYQTSLAEAYQVVRDVIPQLRTYGKAWRVVSHEENKIHAQVPVLLFTDDLVVTLKEKSGGVIVNVRSASRVGKGDFGENRRHILQLLAALDEKLPVAK